MLNISMIFFISSLNMNWLLFSDCVILINVTYNSLLFVRPPQTAILLFCISFLWEWSWSLSPVQCHEPHSIVHQVAATGVPSMAKRRHPTTEVSCRSREDPMPEGWQPRGVTPHPRSGAAAKSARLWQRRNRPEELPRSEEHTSELQSP